MLKNLCTLHGQVFIMNVNLRDATMLYSTEYVLNVNMRQILIHACYFKSPEIIVLNFILVAFRTILKCLIHEHYSLTKYIFMDDLACLSHDTMHNIFM